MIDESKKRIVEGAKKSAAVGKAKKDIRVAEFKQECLCCKNLIPYEKRRNKFCSQSCNAIYNNTRRGSKVVTVPRAPKNIYYCKACQKKINHKGTQFCSLHCCNYFKWEQKKSEIIRSGIYPGRDYNYIRILARRLIRDTIGWKCSICGLKEWNGQEAPMVVDHEDGNAENNSIENVRLVCGNCNMMLPTFSGRNRGSGRTWRKERRDLGKNA